LKIGYFRLANTGKRKKIREYLVILPGPTLGANLFKYTFTTNISTYAATSIDLTWKSNGYGSRLLIVSAGNTAVK
jgi:hypothetical protein